jgi:TetR/AcrR family transcriptional repressor of nem operon
MEGVWRGALNPAMSTASSPEVRDECGRRILGHAAALEVDMSEALGDARADRREPADLARVAQVVLPGAFVVAKAKDDPAVVTDGLAHLRRCLELVLEGG